MKLIEQLKAVLKYQFVEFVTIMENRVPFTERILRIFERSSSSGIWPSCARSHSVSSNASSRATSTLRRSSTSSKCESMNLAICSANKKCPSAKSRWNSASTIKVLSPCNSRKRWASLRYNIASSSSRDPGQSGLFSVCQSVQ